MKQKLGLWVLAYFRWWARLQLTKIQPDVVGITGSVGKTTTRNAVAAILQDKYVTKVSFKANSESGIPLNILGLKPRDYSWWDWVRLALLAPWRVLVDWQGVEKYVVEMGVDGPDVPKNMDYLLTIVKPRTAIFLNAQAVHTMNFDKKIEDESGEEERRERIVDLIAAEKGKLITSLPTNGLAILNIDDKRVERLVSKTQAKVLTLGTSKKADIKIGVIDVSLKGTSFEFGYKQETEKVVLPYLAADHLAYSLAAAIGIGLDEDMDLRECKISLEKNFVLPPGRMSVFAGINESIIIDSSYNASMGPMLEALRLMGKVKGNRKIACLADMRELGLETKRAHEQVMAEAVKHADELVLVGPLMRDYALPYLTRIGFGKVSWWESAQRAGLYLKGVVKKGDTILVKGSQNTLYMEIVVKMLLNSTSDIKRLCRRGEYWDKLRQRSEKLV